MWIEAASERPHFATAFRKPLWSSHLSSSHPIFFRPMARAFACGSSLQSHCSHYHQCLMWAPRKPKWNERFQIRLPTHRTRKSALPAQWHRKASPLWPPGFGVGPSKVEILTPRAQSAAGSSSGAVDHAASLTDRHSFCPTLLGALSHNHKTT